MNFTRITGSIILITAAAQLSFGAQYHVAQDGSAGYTSIQAAVNAASSGDEIIIDDNATYKEQVTIDSTKNNLTLRSANPASSAKPVIMWHDTINTHPHDATEASTPNLPNQFDENGALRILYSRGVTIDGIIVDGGGAFAFGYKSVWVPTGGGTASPLFHGNAALTLTVAGDSKIRNCELRNAFFGIFVFDRNPGGIYANINPSDLDTLTIVPMSGFDKTGNHIIERNRIHDNSFGMFFESSWNLGSVVRYNLFYENHHTSQIEAAIKDLPTSANYPGGAFLFEDGKISPLAIYNNTFRHNYLIYCGIWRAGVQHLIFNNIYSAPNEYLDNYQEMDKVYVYRTHNCVYAVQEQSLGHGQAIFAQEFDADLERMVFSDTIMTYQPSFSNLASEVQTQSFTVTGKLSDGTTFAKTFSGKIPGGLIIGSKATTGFPASANVRWLETSFKSTDPTSPDFLVPDWDDSFVHKYIVDQGWPDAGIRDSDGTLADLGAIPLGGTPSTETVIKPTSPVTISGTTATATFNVSNLSGALTDPVIKYLTWINNPMAAKDSGSWSGDVTPIPAANIFKIAIPLQKITIGENTVVINLPSGLTPGQYAFLEMTIEGTDPSTGNKVTSEVGFLPFISSYTTRSFHSTRPSSLIPSRLNVDLLNLKGQVVKRAKNVNCSNRVTLENALHMRTLPQGVYLLRMKSEKGGAVGFRKIIR